MDHHRSDVPLACQKCDQKFSTPCALHKHLCHMKDQALGCLICLKLGASEAQAAFEPIITEVRGSSLENSMTQVYLDNEDLDVKENVIGQGHLKPIEEIVDRVGEESAIEEPLAEDIEESPEEIVAEPTKKAIEEPPNVEESHEIEYDRDEDMDNEYYTSDYDSQWSCRKITKHKIIRKKEDWFLCTDCDPPKLLFEDDSVGAHLGEFRDHFHINPAWLYSKARLILTDIKEMGEYQSYFYASTSKRPRSE